MDRIVGASVGGARPPGATSPASASARVWPQMGEDELRERLALALADEGVDPAVVVAELAAGADPGFVATAGPRYFGFVIGGTLPGRARRRLARQRVGPVRLRRAGLAGDDRGRGGRGASWSLELLGPARARARSAS